jgi:hypothetical protein
MDAQPRLLPDHPAISLEGPAQRLAQPGHRSRGLSFVGLVPRSVFLRLVSRASDAPACKPLQGSVDAVRGELPIPGHPSQRTT